MKDVNKVIFILFTFIISSPVKAASRCLSATIIAHDDLKEKFGASIFKVFSVKGSKESIGTAALIDSRGLFITSSHILEDLSGWDTKGSDWQKNKPQFPFPKPVYLVNYMTGVKVSALEISNHRGNRLEPDVTILKAIDNHEWEQEDSFKLLMGEKNSTDNSEKEVWVLGFRVASKVLEIQYPKNLTLFKEKPSLNHLAFIEDSSAEPGLSGSLAIDKTGIGVAILKGNITPVDSESWELDTSLFKNRLFFSVISHQKVINAILPAWKEAMGLNKRIIKIKKLIQSKQIMPPNIAFNLEYKRKYYPFELYFLRDEIIELLKKKTITPSSIDIIFMQSLMRTMSCHGIDISELYSFLKHCITKKGVEGSGCNEK